jgi:hypothetical protein
MKLRANINSFSSHLELRCRHSRCYSRATVVAAATPGTAAASQVVFPHSDTIHVDGRDVDYRQIIDMLAPAVTPERLEKMQQVRIGFGRVAK